MAFLSNKRIVSLLVLILLLFSCKEKTYIDDEHYKKILTVLPQGIADQYDQFLVFGGISCEGCVQNNLDDYVQNYNQEVDQKTIFVLDTNRTGYYNIIKEKVSHIHHVPIKDIDKNFKRIANITIYKKDSLNKILKVKIFKTSDFNIVENINSL